ncbi:uncharacterized protein K441DRAFT_303769 [Cenococcum geophilum 1.58]|uniref:uncharacterized protein n=1 Tax=Cenococcum geophilum 1.58 TaxID=794803 RepID=UPI00358EF9A4|nr:hypothetical protein K441DRAFT_303769 [Cenococcum geophilum 1.58]
MAIDNRIYKVIQRERKRDYSGANGVYMVLVVMINMGFKLTMTLLNASASASPLPYPWRGMRCSYCGLTLHRTVCWWANAVMLPQCFRGFGEKAPDKRLHWTKIPIISNSIKHQARLNPTSKCCQTI